MDPGFIPLGNRNNLRPDWYEFWVIRDFLQSNSLDGEKWYGFLSPKFGLKTGLSAQHIYRFLESSEEKADVALVAYAWDQIAYFRNPFEQGEFWHSGILSLSQSAFEKLGCKVRLQHTVCHSGNFAFSNFIIARPRYWQKWLEMANKLFTLVEGGDGTLGERLRSTTPYAAVVAPIKAFIQERIPLLIILENGFRTSTYALYDVLPPFGAIFADTPQNPRLLLRCDELKKRFTETGDPKYLDDFYATRSLVALSVR